MRRAVVERAGAVAATSANLHGAAGPAPPGRDPGGAPLGRRRGRRRGQLPGTPSTVVDLTGDEPKILREGAVSAEETLTRIAAALR